MKEMDNKQLIKALERISRVLALDYASQANVEPSEKAKILSQCGFSNVEVAGLLGMTANAVNVALHRARKSKK
jgi:DNA-directed RNA polymerase specialized sigma24 family protein